MGYSVRATRGEVGQSDFDLMIFFSAALGPRGPDSSRLLFDSYHLSLIHNKITHTRAALTLTRDFRHRTDPLTNAYGELHRRIHVKSRRRRPAEQLTPSGFSSGFSLADQRPTASVWVPSPQGFNFVDGAPSELESQGPAVLARPNLCRSTQTPQTAHPGARADLEEA